jgi:aspartate aminotransferase
MFVDIRDVLTAASMKDSLEFAEALLATARVALTPGEGFGAPGFVRISYATSIDDLREGSRRMVEFVGGKTKNLVIG